MIVESIKHNRESSKLVNTSYSPAIKSPSKGYFKLDLHQAWINFIKRYEPFTWYVTLTFKEPKHPELADKAFLDGLDILMSLFMVDAIEREKRALLGLRQ